MEVMKQLRQRAIRDLVEQRPIRTQQELAAALRERGFRTTQATISRDVAELGLVKVDPRRRRRPTRCRRACVEAETSGEDRLRTLLHDLPVEIREAGPAARHPDAARVRPPDRRGARPGPLAGGRGLDRRRRHASSSPSPIAPRSGSALQATPARASPVATSVSALTPRERRD